MEKILVAAFLILLLPFLSNTPSLAGVIEPDLEVVLTKTGTEQEIPVILTLSEKVDLTLFKEKDKKLLRSNLIKALKQKAYATQAPINLFLVGKGVNQIRSLWTINGLLIKARPEVIRELADQPKVERIRLDQIQRFRDGFRGIRTHGPRSMRSNAHSPQVSLESKGSPLGELRILSPSAKPEWNLDLIRAPELWKKGFTGKGVVVASMDTGIDLLHPDLKNKWRGGSNSWFDPFGEHEIPFDSSGHGTQTMGIMVGGYAGGTAIGIAPGAQWMAVKLFNDAGQTSLGVWHFGFQWLLDPDGVPETNDSPDIVNLSWGFNRNVNQCNPEFLEDIRVLKTARVAVIFAGGNEGPNPSTSLSPANYSGSISVGAIDMALNMANFSSRGPSACDGSAYPHIVAPGVNVKTTDLTFGGISPAPYATVTGTSFAAAHISGVVALLISAFPDLMVSELESVLKQSVLGLDKGGVDNTYGYGLVNTIEAYHYLLPMIEETDLHVDRTKEKGR